MDRETRNNLSKLFTQTIAEGDGNRRQHLFSHILSQQLQWPFSMLVFFFFPGRLDSRGHRHISLEKQPSGKRLAHVVNSSLTFPSIVSLASFAIIPESRANRISPWSRDRVGL
jgi:hypothetical protein